MTQYLTIPTTKSTAGVDGITFNVDLITTVVYTGTTTFVIYVNNRTYTFTTSAAGAAGAVAVINNALAAGGQPLASTVVLPAGTTIANIPAVV
jgi:hypothetical protein